MSHFCVQPFNPMKFLTAHKLVLSFVLITIINAILFKISPKFSFIFAFVGLFLLLIALYLCAWSLSRSLSTKAGMTALFTFEGIFLLSLILNSWQARAGFLCLIALLWYYLLTGTVTFVLNKVSPSLFKRRIVWHMTFFVSLLTYSLWSAYSPTVRHYEITLANADEDFSIALVSDIHLGHWVGNRQLEKLNRLIRAEKPDLIVLVGDIINDDPTPYYQERMPETLSKLTAPLGVYATLGNHEYYGDADKNAQAIEKAGIPVLRDRGVKLTNNVTLIGRNDDHDKKRKSLATLIQESPQTKLRIVLDHRPSQIRQAQDLPVDIMLSGHTHKGQIFPFNLVTSKVYPLDYGYKKFKNGHFFVSSGFGFWGFPLRLGSRAEIIMIQVKAEKS